jgi:hypothetical protein
MKTSNRRTSSSLVRGRRGASRKPSGRRTAKSISSISASNFYFSTLLKRIFSLKIVYSSTSRERVKLTTSQISKYTENVQPMSFGETSKECKKINNHLPLSNREKDQLPVLRNCRAIRLYRRLMRTERTEAFLTS